MAFHLDDLSAIPHTPGVYLFYGKKNDILYIGKAKDLRKRVSQYFSPGSMWKQDMLSKAEKIDFITVTTESEALYLEDNLIKKHKPMYNSLLKADNSYVYIKITSDPYPLVMTTRSRIADGSHYIGPKHSTRELYTLLQYLRKLLRYRTCTNTTFKQGKICSDYHFGSCAGWCIYARMKDDEELQQAAKIAGRGLAVNASFHPEFTHEESLQENKHIVKLLIDFFAGKTKSIEEKLMQQMKDAVSKQHFEYAAKLRDLYSGLQGITEKQHVVLGDLVTGKIMKIREIAGWYVLAIVNMYEGKMIDVIRLKYRVSDTELDDIISDFRTEYGECLVEKNEQYTLCFTKQYKKLAAATRAEVSALLDRFIDAMVASSTFEKENIMDDMLQELQTRYELPAYPYGIECVDISHLSGGRVSGALVSMREGLLNKKGYRKYKIGKVALEKTKEQKSTTKKITARDSDDYASLREVLIRRFQGVSLEDQFLPDVFILDGGKGQLGVVQKLYEEKERFRELFHRIHFCALGKGEARARSSKSRGATEHVYWYDQERNIKEKALLYDDIDRLMTSLRDEAHRFANKYRTKQMSMEWKQ